MKELYEMISRIIIVIFCLYSTFSIISMNNVVITNQFVLTKFIPIFLIGWAILPIFDFIKKIKIQEAKEE